MSDRIHFVTATLYIFAHVPLMHWMQMDLAYWIAFFTCLLLVMVTLSMRKRQEVQGGVVAEHTRHPLLRSQQVAALPYPQQRFLFYTELVLMCAENGIFLAFILGMRSHDPLTITQLSGTDSELTVD